MVIKLGQEVRLSADEVTDAFHRRIIEGSKLVDAALTPHVDLILRFEASKRSWPGPRPGECDDSLDFANLPSGIESVPRIDDAARSHS